MDLLLVLQTAFGIGLLIFVHELGHFLAARLARVRVDVFSLGFGPRLLGFQRGTTDYRLSLVPLGGYVAVAGESPADPRHGDAPAENALNTKSFRARALFFSGGVLMNVAFALVAFPIAFHAGVSFDAPVIGAVEPGGAAWRAGLDEGDRVVEVDGKRIYSMRSLRVETALSGGDGAVPFVIERDGERVEVPVRPRYASAGGIYMLRVDGSVAPEPIVVAGVDSGSPAAAAGLRAGDRIVAIDGEPLVGAAANRALLELQRGEPRELTLRVRREGVGETELTFTPGTRRAERARIGVIATTDHVDAVRPAPVVEALGLAVGDRILSVDGAPFDPTQEQPFAGDAETLRIRVARNDRELTLTGPGAAESRQQLTENVALRAEVDSLRIAPVADTPAARAGLRPGDRVSAIDGEPVETWDELVAAVQRAANGDEPRPLRFTVLRDGERQTLLITPERPVLVDLGFDRRLQYLQQVRREASFVNALGAGMVASVDLVKQLYVTLKRIFTGDVSARNLGGIITISRASYAEAQGGWVRFLYFLGLLSINLAFVNVLPIPVLDGGHLLFLLIERIKGSPVSAEVVNYSQIIGLVFVVALMVFVTYNDILRI